MPNRQMRQPAAASPTTSSPRKTAQILPFSPVTEVASLAECVASTRAPSSQKPVKLTCAPNTYAHLNVDGTFTVRTRIRATDRFNPNSGQRVRYNIELVLEQWISDMEVAAKVYELREKVRRGWNPRGARLTLREYFYTEVMPNIAQTSRSPKTALSRFRSLIEPYLGDKKIGEITAADIRRWRDGLLSEGGL